MNCPSSTFKSNESMDHMAAQSTLSAGWALIGSIGHMQKIIFQVILNKWFCGSVIDKNGK